MRVKSKWHKSKKKSTDDIGSAMAFNCWRITRNELEDLINEGFIIEKEQLFDIISEYLCFLIQATDRLIYQKIPDNERQKIMVKLVKQSAQYYHENKFDQISKKEEHWQEFLKKFNDKTKDYSSFAFNKKPSLPFYRYFANGILNAMTEADEKWILSQMIEIQAPKAFKSLNKSVQNLINVDSIA
ncbi:hypothetical protein MNB_SUP05-5-1070 [hydrothermal vent metagenome]|uniref:Uncharacterized protein n=1 Tax=hydrothermal vent metagenome TaxID=652676 RepID=A0A1W1CHL8_9ZZZZ